MGWILGLGNGVVFRTGSSPAWSSYWAKQLTRNTDIVEAGNYQVVDTTGDDLSLPPTGRWYLNKNNIGRVRQSGEIISIKFWIETITGTGLLFQVWRKDGATYDLVGEEDITASCTSRSINTINLITPISVQSGDFVGLGGIGVVTGFRGKNITTAGSLRYVAGTKPSATNYAWDSGSTITYGIPLKIYMQAPTVILIGDSLVAGHSAHYSFVENVLTDDISGDIASQLTLINSKYVCQNMGIGSQTSTDIKNRFAADVVALKPKIAIINGGVNDIDGGAISKATFLSNYTTMLDACLTNDILPVVCKILPWTNGTNEQMQTRDEWMTDLKTLVESATYNGAVWVDFDAAMGKNRVGGDVGNLWDLQTTPDYDQDGVHPTLLGYTKMAEVINAAVSTKGYVLT